ncbi:MAG: lipoprotein insertase outer membrane protein LolB [Candidatus Thioglobus sp.]|uniref:lipoprotein insertase outer membrane protein LolB n=1 Tax=Candidatus Thioglobus sp. TaxID=2026721 RepID=UPI00261EB147|nr:lipoprotein insertase outer membrane protein LolB [Candidatus Thioglobus sp.]MDC9726692.1 lipoprotein insertase outer membrane protein LolB [Candidatus Thioglobus sp.]
MKTLLSLLLLLLLSSCSTLPVPQSKTTLIDPQGSWQVNGRLSAIVDNKAQQSSFKLKFNGKDFDLTLTGVLGIGQMNLTSSASKLRVDGQLTQLSLNQLMTQELGWYFPIEQLRYIIFEQQLLGDSLWQLQSVKLAPGQSTKVTKIAKLKHLTKPIKIKLLFQEILSN